MHQIQMALNRNIAYASHVIIITYVRIFSTLIYVLRM